MTKSKRDQCAEIFRRHNWNLIQNYGVNLSNFQLEFWVGPNGGQCLWQVWTGDGGVSTFFLGGGHTWDELEAELQRMGLPKCDCSQQQLESGNYSQRCPAKFRHPRVRLKFDYNGGDDDGERYPIIAEGQSLMDAINDLDKKLMFAFGAEASLVNYPEELSAICEELGFEGTPGTKFERNDFADPERNYSITIL